MLVIDAASLVVLVLTGDFPVFAPELRYAAGLAALALSAFGVNRAIIVPPLKDIEIHIPGLADTFDGYRIVQLTDLHISWLVSCGLDAGDGDKDQHARGRPDRHYRRLH